ncbi:hypothetical protein JZ751_006879, partial [Albula glossodonta]
MTFGQIRYSVPEEMKKGSFVGNIAQDLGIDPKRMKSGGARIVSGDSSEYIELNVDKGILVIRDRIDREQLCGQTSPCSLALEIIMSNPMQLHSVVVEILDINDNAPLFAENEIKLDILESAVPGTRILQESATDPDVGINALQTYTIKPTDNFNIKIQSSPDGSKYVESNLPVIPYYPPRYADAGGTGTLQHVYNYDACSTTDSRKSGCKFIRPCSQSVLIVDPSSTETIQHMQKEMSMLDEEEVPLQFTYDKDYNENMTFYLVLALAIVSFLFISCLVILISVKIYRWRQSRIFYQSNLPIIPYYPPRYADAGGTGTLQHVYNYEVCRTTDSRKSDIKYLRPISQSLVSVDVNGTETIPHEHKERASMETEYSSK